MNKFFDALFLFRFFSSLFIKLNNNSRVAQSVSTDTHDERSALSLFIDLVCQQFRLRFNFPLNISFHFDAHAFSIRFI